VALHASSAPVESVEKPPIPPLFQAKPAFFPYIICKLTSKEADAAFQALFLLPQFSCFGLSIIRFYSDEPATAARRGFSTDSLVAMFALNEIIGLRRRQKRVKKDMPRKRIQAAFRAAIYYEIKY
jgi:hypothetical protein